MNRIFSYGQSFGDAAYVATVNPNSVSNSTYLSNVIFYELTTVNTWKHMVFTYEQSTSTVKIYLNGELKTNGTFSSLNTSEFVVELYLGTLFNSTTQRYFGYVDDLKIYNYALTDAQVTSLYTNNTLTVSNFNAKPLEITLFPNPTKDKFTIATVAEIATVEIYSAQGQKVLTATQKIIDMSSLASGVYFVKIETTEKIQTIQKLVKQ